MITDNGKGLIFLLGLPRSGTTLFSTLLANHPLVAAPSETWMMLGLEQVSRVSLRHPAGSQILGPAIRKFQGNDGLVEGARAYAKTVYNRHLSACERQILVDKTPRYYLIIDFLRSVFPDARLLLLLRNPLDVAASFKDSWNINIPQAITEAWDDPICFDFVVGVRRLAELHKEQGVHTVRYESLVTNAADVMTGVYKFLGLSVDEMDASLFTDFDLPPFSPGGMGDHKIHDTNHVHNNSVDKWQESFSTKEAQTIATAVGWDTLKTMGYHDVLDKLEAKGIQAPDKKKGDALIAPILSALSDRLEDIELISKNEHYLERHVQANTHTLLHGPIDLAEDSVARRLMESDEEYTDRMRQIEALTAHIHEIEADNADRMRQIVALTGLLQESEEDRTARLAQIQELTALINKIKETGEIP